LGRDSLFGRFVKDFALANPNPTTCVRNTSDGRQSGGLNFTIVVGEALLSAMALTISFSLLVFALVQAAQLNELFQAAAADCV
jgi:hypothetical protein